MRRLHVSAIIKGELLEDAVVPLLVGVAKNAPGHKLSHSQVI